MRPWLPPLEELRQCHPQKDGLEAIVIKETAEECHYQLSHAIQCQQKRNVEYLNRYPPTWPELRRPHVL
jgi:hypothetical protein